MIKQVSDVSNISSNMASTGVPFIISSFIGLPTYAALDVGDGVLLFSKLLEYFNEVRKIQENNMVSYLINIRKITGTKF